MNEQLAAPNQMMLPQSPMPAPVTHDVKIRSTKKKSRARVMGVPPEEWGIERGARGIPDSNYCFHDVVTKTQADLIDEGYDAEQIEALSDYTGRTDVETLARDTVQEHYNSGAGQINKASRRVKVTEHYIRIDYEGTGRPCLYQIVTGGDRGEILKKNGKPAVVQFDRMPFAGASPIPVAHRFFGRSIADQTMDIQRIKTAILRGVLDNAYMVTNPRTEIAESHAGANTLDDMLTSRPNGIVRTKTPGGLNPLMTPSIGQYLMPVMEYMDAIREMRTGVTRQGQGVDADALQNQTATAVQHVFSASQARMKLIARVMSEGVRDIMVLLHATIRKHGQEAQTVRLRNNWVEVDPRNWKTRNDLTINVGLGDGGKAEQMGRLALLANAQEKIITAGKTNIVDDEKIWNLASEMTKTAGFKNPDRFFNDVTQKDPQTGQPKFPPPQAPPDPKVMAIQAQAQNDQQELAMKAQLDQQKAQDAAALAQFKADIDAKLKMIEAHMKALEMDRKAQADTRAHHAKVAETVIGVVADAHKHDMAMAHEQQMHDQKMDQAETAHQAKLEQMKSKPKGDA
jgi:hypothetical protein